MIVIMTVIRSFGNAEDATMIVIMVVIIVIIFFIVIMILIFIAFLDQGHSFSMIVIIKL